MAQETPRAERTQSPRIGRAGTLLLLVGTLLVVFVLIFGVNMRRGLNHDEHQFIASAALLARQGLLPYRDFPYFHMPTLVLVDALLFAFTDHLLLVARLVSLVSATLAAGLLLLLAMRLLLNLTPARRAVVAVLTVLLLIATPATIHASGRAWNHDLPLLFALAAFVPFAIGLAQRKLRWLWLAVAGLLIGAAAGVRLSYAPLALPFLLAAIYLAPACGVSRWRACVLFSLGMLLGLLPAIVLFALAPEQFMFGNFGYPRLNTAYYRQLAAEGDLFSLSGKVLDTARSLFGAPGNLLPLLLCGLELWRVRASLRINQSPEIFFWLLLWPFLIAGALAPTPIQQQYIYPFFPFLAAGFVLALAHDRMPKWGVRLLIGVTAVSLLFAAPAYVQGLQVVFTPNEWFPLKAHARGEQLAQLTGDGRVISLSPIYPLEGRAGVYKQFSTGPLAWRVAPLMSADLRTRIGVISSDDLDALWVQEPPRAIFTGLHDDDADVEAVLVEAAQRQGYIPIALPEEGVLWVSPLVDWGGAIQLGAHTLPDEPLRPGQEFIATFHLMNTAPIADDLNVLVRGVDSAGRELFRSEGWPYGSPTSKWQTGEVWADGHTLQIPDDARPGVLRVEVSFYDPQTLATLGEVAVVDYLLVEEPDAVAPDAPVARFGEAIDLLQVQAPITATAGAPLAVQTIWRVGAPVATDYTAFVHVIGPDGHLVAQVDRPPTAGFYPISAWRAGWPVDDSFTLTLPVDAQPGEYRVLLGLYDPTTMQRLPVIQNERASGDALQVATVRVEG